MNRDFNKIYEDICSNGFEEMMDYKKTRNRNLTLFLLATILTMLLFEKLFRWNEGIIFIGLLLVLATFINFMVSDWKYKKAFKTNIIRKIIRLYHKDFIFDPSRGVTSTEYLAGFQDGYYTEFHSEDSIDGFIDCRTHLKMSQVTITREDVQVNSNGQKVTKKVVLFSGLYGFVTAKDKLLTSLEIKANKFLKRYSKDRIEIDSQEFEKQYDLFAENKVHAMEIFTSDLIDEINMLKEDTGFPIELKVKKNTIYFRIPCGETFEAPLLKDANDYNTLYKYFRMIDSPIAIAEKIVKNAEETQV